MSLVYDPHPFTTQSKQKAITDLLATTRPDRDFYVLLIGAAVLAIGALFTDSIPVLIASMIVAPLAQPIVSLGLGFVAGSGKLVARSLGMLVTGSAVALLLAMVATWLFGHHRVADHYISFASSHDIAVVVAFAAGAVATYGTIRPRVAAAITGVAIAVSLLPPLVAIGIGFAGGDRTLGIQALELFLLNVAGILLASMITFWCFGMGREYRIMEAKNEATPQ